MGKIPKGGEGSDPNPLHIFLCFFSNSGAEVKFVHPVRPGGSVKFLPVV